MGQAQLIRFVRRVNVRRLQLELIPVQFWCVTLSPDLVGLNLVSPILLYDHIVQLLLLLRFLFHLIERLDLVRGIDHPIVTYFSRVFSVECRGQFLE
jgi:hypothetical protein